MAVPSPYQAGRKSRACDHEKTQGMARKTVQRDGAATAGRRPGAECQPGQLDDGRGGGEERLEGRVLPDQRAIHVGRPLGQLFEDDLAPHLRVSCLLLVRRRRGHQHRVGELREVPHGDVEVGVAIGDHLALLGDLERTVERVGRTRQDGPTHRPATAPDGTAPAVEQGQPDAVTPSGRSQLGLGAMEQPGRRQGA